MRGGREGGLTIIIHNVHSCNGDGLHIDHRETPPLNQRTLPSLPSHHCHMEGVEGPNMRHLDPTHSKGVTNVEFSRDTSHLLSCPFDATIK